jgi:hypothetical protein
VVRPLYSPSSLHPLPDLNLYRIREAGCLAAQHPWASALLKGGNRALDSRPSDQGDQCT